MDPKAITAPPSTIDLQTKQNHGLCVQCNQPAHQQCSGCKGLPAHDDKKYDPPYYCGAECQKLHRPRHKTTCRAMQQRRAVYRIGSILQPLFYTWAEINWYYPISKVTRTGNCLHVDARPSAPGHQNHVFTFGPFPATDIVPLRYKNAILSAFQCSAFLCFMWPVIEVLVKGIPCKAQELSLNVLAEMPCRIMFQRQTHETLDVRNYRHEVLCLQLKTGEMMVVDATAAQQGFKESVVSWDVYKSQRDPLIRERHEFGHWASTYHKDTPMMCPDVKVALMQAMDRSFRQQAHNVSVQQALISASVQEFSAKSDFVISHVTKSMRECFETFHKPGAKFKRIDGWSVLRSLKLENSMEFTTSRPIPASTDLVASETKEDTEAAISRDTGTLVGPEWHGTA